MSASLVGYFSTDYARHAPVSRPPLLRTRRRVAAMQELRELARILRELEGAPLEVRTAAAQRVAAWTQRHAPLAAAESCAAAPAARRLVVL
jgi:hypothetical protein